MECTKLLIVLLALISSVHSWYNCDDKEFCEKIRYKEPNHHFILDEDTIHLDGSTVSGTLINTDTNQELVFLVRGYSEKLLRFTINDPEKVRFIPLEALNNPVENDLSLTEHGNGSILIENGGTSAHINFDPFIIIVSTNEIEVTINGEGRMEFLSEENDEAVSMDFKFKGASTVYGLPERSQGLALQSTGPGIRDPYRMYNVDYPGYDVKTSEALYGAEPVLYAHGIEHTSGVFWLNSAQTFVDVSAENDARAQFISEGGAIDFFVLHGPTLRVITRQYAFLTGTAPLPPLFSLGYHQSRWGYATQEDLETVSSELARNGFPTDVMWLDIDYTDGKKYFTWNYTAFPDPIGMQQKLESSGRKLVLIIDPHIKVEEGYFVYDQAIENDYFVKNENGDVYEGVCWPGLSSYVDFSNPDALAWWSSLYSYDNFPDTTHIVHIWNDMNEPSVFDVDEKTMPNSNLHYNGWTHRDLHNIYGFLQSKGTYLGMQERYNHNTRPFVLTRSHFSGTQRYSAVWTGDNNAEWSHLQISIPMCLTFALAGISFCGADIGGFNNNPSEELLQRWYQLGSWLPFFREHSGDTTERREPYLYPPQVQNVIRKAINDRYQHLPYWYTLFYEHERFGDPVLRPLSYNHPMDENTFDIDDQFYVGNNILVFPVVKEGYNEFKEIYIPDGTWYHSSATSGIVGPQKLLIYVEGLEWSPQWYREGSIIPRKDYIRLSTEYMEDDPYDLYIYGSQAQGTLYVDDYKSYDYQNKAFHFLEFNFDGTELTVRKIVEDADYKQIYLNSVHLNGKPWPDNKTPVVTINGTKASHVKFENGKNYLKLYDLNVDISKEIKIKIE